MQNEAREVVKAALTELRSRPRSTVKTNSTIEILRSERVAMRELIGAGYSVREIADALIERGLKGTRQTIERYIYAILREVRAAPKSRLKRFRPGSGTVADAGANVAVNAARAPSESGAETVMNQTEGGGECRSESEVAGQRNAAEVSNESRSESATPGMEEFLKRAASLRPKGV